MNPSEKTYDQIEAWIRECFGILSQDVRRVLANRFPLIADEAVLEQYIPIDSVYTDLVGSGSYAELRRALINIASHVSGLGYESSIRSFLDRLTGGGYTLFVFPLGGGSEIYLGDYNGLVITLFDRTHEAAVRNYLNIVLPPYISYIINTPEEES